MRPNVQDVFLYTNGGLKIFKRYIKHDFILKKAFSSPFRKDKNPSFSIYRSADSNKYLFKDFARDDLSGDAIRFVELLYNLDFNSALNKITDDFGMLPIKKQTATKPTIHMRILEKELSPDDIKHFLQFGINEDVLQKFNVKSVAKFSTKNSWIHSSTSNPIFLYKFDWGRKIYNPNGNIRFLYTGTTPSPYIFGIDQLPDSGKLLIITGGEKDVMTFSALGYNAITFNSESANIDEKTINRLRKRFKYIAVCYDADITGKKASEEISKKFSITNIELPLSGKKDDKDISDFVRNGIGKDAIYELINKAIDKRFEETIRVLNAHTFNEQEKIDKPIPVLKVVDHNILSLGNIMVLAGKVKTGKSAVLYSIIAGSICTEGTEIDTLGIDVIANNSGKAVIHFDTEQSKYDWHTRIKRSLERAKLNAKPEFFNSYHILEFSYWDRIRYIEEVIEYNYRKYNGIHLVLVDGVADLIKSVNDEERSNYIVDLFHRLSVEYRCPIVLVVHLNPDGNKTRGHLGSQLDRKAESVIIIEREGDICTINPKYCRNANAIDVPLMQFTWDSNFEQHVCIGSKSVDQKKEKRIDEYIDILDEIFTNGISMISKSEFKNLLSEKMDVKRSATYNAINFMIAEKLIIEKDSEENEKMIARDE